MEKPLLLCYCDTTKFLITFGLCVFFFGFCFAKKLLNQFIVLCHLRHAFAKLCGQKVSTWEHVLLLCFGEIDFFAFLCFAVFFWKFLLGKATATEILRFGMFVFCNSLSKLAPYIFFLFF